MEENNNNIENTTGENVENNSIEENVPDTNANGNDGVELSNTVPEETPVNNDTVPTGDFVLPEEKKKGPHKGIIAVVIILAVAAIAVAVLMSNPRRIINSAVTNTATQISQRNGVYKNLADNFDTDFYLNNNIQGGFSATLEDAGEDGQYMNGVGLDVDYKVDRGEKKAAADLGCTYNSQPLGTLNIFMTKEEWFVKIGKLYDAWFKGKNDNIYEQFSKSAFNKDGSFEYNPEEEVSVGIFDKDTGNDIVADFVEKYVKDTAVLAQNIEYGKLKESRSVNGTNCKGYSLTVKGEDVKTYVMSVANGLNEEENKEAADILLKGVDVTAKDIVDKLENTEFEDVVLEFYINKNTIYELDTTVSANIDGKENSINCIFTNSGDNLVLSCTNNVGSTMSFNDTINVDGSVITQTDSFSISDKYSTMDAKLDVSYNTDSAAISADASVERDEQKELELTATGTAVGEKNSLDISFDKVAVNSGESSAEFSGDWYMKELTEKIEEPQGDIIAIFEESEEKVQDIIGAIQEKVYSYIYAYYGMTS